MGLKDLKQGEVFEGDVLVQKVRVPGPTILSVFDGTIAFDAVTHNHTFNQGDVIHLKARLGSRNGNKQLEILEAKISDIGADDLLARFSTIEDIDPICADLSPMRVVFTECATRIRKSILLGQDIIVHYHADADGICSVLAIDKAVRSYASSIQSPSRIYRHPSRSPYLDKTDLLRDISSDALILLLDCGSGSENKFAFSLLASRGFEVVVIDHHHPDDSLQASIHVNPFFHGLDQRYTAGILCYEVGRLIDPKFDDILLPAVSTIGDRSEIEIYKDKAHHPDLVGIAKSMDFFAYFLRFDPGYNVYDILFEDDTRKIVVGEIEKLDDIQFSYINSDIVTEDAGEYKLVHFDLTLAKNDYPRPGKVCGIVFDRCLDTKGVVIGYFPDMLIMRARDPIMPLPDLLVHLKNIFPDSLIDGGGHDVAASITFAKLEPKKIIGEIKRLLESRHE